MGVDRSKLQYSGKYVVIHSTEETMVQMALMANKLEILKPWSLNIVNSMKSKIPPCDIDREIMGFLKW